MTTSDIVTESGPEAEELELAPEARKIEGRSPWKLAFERLRKDRASMISLVVIVLVVAFAVLAPVVASVTGHGVREQFRDDGLSIEGLPVGPGGKFLLGTDFLGRDVLVRI